MLLAPLCSAPSFAGRSVPGPHPEQHCRPRSGCDLSSPAAPKPGGSEASLLRSRPEHASLRNGAGVCVRISGKILEGGKEGQPAADGAGGPGAPGCWPPWACVVNKPRGLTRRGLVGLPHPLAALQQRSPLGTGLVRGSQHDAEPAGGDRQPLPAPGSGHCLEFTGCSLKASFLNNRGWFHISLESTCLLSKPTFS